MSGPALSEEQILARRKAAADLAFLEDPEADRSARRAARLAEVDRKVSPLNKRILHSRKAWREGRKRSRAARVSRRRNRVS